MATICHSPEVTQQKAVPEQTAGIQQPSQQLLVSQCHECGVALVIPKNCPASAGNLKPSDLDGQTIIPSSHKKFIPVFDKPKYCPFGLGYRRCPAEIFNYFFTGKLMQKIGDFLAPSPYTPGFIFTTYSVLASLCLEPFVTGYYEERRNMVVDAEDKSTFVYWWNLGKLLFSILPSIVMHYTLMKLSQDRGDSYHQFTTV